MVLESIYTFAQKLQNETNLSGARTILIKLLHDFGLEKIRRNLAPLALNCEGF